MINSIKSRKIPEPLSNDKYSKNEEIMHALSHAFGIILGVIGTTLLISFAVLTNRESHIFSYIIYGLSFILMFTASTVYHSFPNSKNNKTFKIIDHISIYIFIAGTYTPFVLIHLKTQASYLILLFVWVGVLLGSISKIFYTGKQKFLSTVIYIIMGWLIIIDGKSVSNLIDEKALFYLFLGGVSYTVGAFFYLYKKISYNHLIWHMFVLVASIFHFFAVFFSTKWF